MVIEDTSLPEDNLTIIHLHINSIHLHVNFIGHRLLLYRTMYSYFKLCSLLLLNQIREFHPSLRIT